MADTPSPFTVPLAEAVEPFVLSLDVGSTGTRGGLYDATGRPIEGSRQKRFHSFRTSAEGRSAISPDLVVHEISEILDAIATPQFAGRIAGVALDTFASSIIAVDEENIAITPCYTYADSRCAPEVEELRALIDERALQQRTGTRLHTSYLPGRLRWIERTQPDTFEYARSWMSLGEYVYLRLLGARGCAVSTAAWSGMLNRHSGDWDEELLEVTHLRRDQLAPLRNPDEPFTRLPRSVAKRWRGLSDAVWFASVPDGIASNLGPGAHDERTMALSASTSGAMRVLLPGIPERIPEGLWCYRIDDHRSLLGGALNDVGRVLTWLDLLTVPPAEGTRDDAFLGPPSASSPLVLPFLTGERSTGWKGYARAVLAEVSYNTDPTTFYRGMMEGVAMSYRRIAEQMETMAPDVQRIVTSGSIAEMMPNWMAVVASIVNLPITPVKLKRSTLRGTALLALESLAPDVARAEPELLAVLEPNPEWAQIYNQRYERFLALYDAVFG